MLISSCSDNNLPTTNTDLNGSSSTPTSSFHVKESIVTTHEENDYSEVVKLNQYTFEKFLGKGTYGSVYSARDETTNQVFAIKTLSKRRMQRVHLEQLLKSSRRKRATFPHPPHNKSEPKPTPQRQEQQQQHSLIQKEIAILKQLRHPNCVKLYEVLDHVEGDEMYMVFELCPHGPIFNIASSTPCEPLSEETSRNYFIQTLLGLEYLHAHHVIHRDIKPENLLLSPDRTVKIVDFGVSEYFTTSDQIDTCAGSPYFLAPELISAKQELKSGRAADVWALGVTLFAMVYGRFPFEGASIVTLYDAIQHAPLDLSGAPSPAVADLLQRVLERCPHRRLTLDEIRHHPWCAAVPIPSAAENLVARVREEQITQRDLDGAISHVQPIWNVIRFTANLKRAIKRHRETDERPPLAETDAHSTVSGSPPLSPE